MRSKLNRELMQTILDSFVTLTDIRAAFISEDKEWVNGRQKPICPFCSMIKGLPALSNICRSSDDMAFRQARITRNLVFYRCPTGLWEAVTPIYTHDILVGYLMIGQVRKAESNESMDALWSDIEARLSENRLDSEQKAQIKNAWTELPIISEDKLQAAVKMLQIMTQALLTVEVIQWHDADAITKTREFLESHYHHPVTLQQIAAHAELNPTYLSNLYHAGTGVTISETLNRLRLDHAARLLETGRLTVKQVAHACGFSDQNYFSRFFRKHWGVSPQAFRKQCRQSETGQKT